MMVVRDIRMRTTGAWSRMLPSAVVDRIEEHLRRHFSVPVAALFSEVLQRGDIVDAMPHAPGVIAYRQGILFVAGTEYVIDGD